MAGRASIVGAAVTHVGKVREHNEDAHFFDGENGVFLVCDGMGGHAAGEVASAIAIKTIRATWSDAATHGAIDGFLSVGTPESKKQLLTVLRSGVIAAHDAIIAEATRDETKAGMGTTLVGAIVVGGDVMFAHAGDSRAYLVRDTIAMQLTEDHTLLSRLLAAGIDVDLTGDGARFKSMLTNALGIGQDCKVATFVVPLADGDRFLLCSDGISEYVKESEIGEVLTKAASPSRAAQKLVDMALDRGGGDNATALVVRVLEAGESPLPVERRKRDDDVIAACSLWGLRVNPQQRLRALRIAIPRDHAAGDKIPAQTLGDRVAWILLEGEVAQDGKVLGPATLLYPEALIATATVPDRDGLAIAVGDVRALGIRADDFKEICDEDADLGEALLEALVNLMPRRPNRRPAQVVVARAKTDPGDPDGEPTVILTGPPTRSVSDATQPLMAIGRSDTLQLDAVEPPEEPISARVPTKRDTQRARSQPDPDEPAMIESVKPPADPPPPVAARPAVDGGEALRELWSPAAPVVEPPKIATPKPPSPVKPTSTNDSTQPLRATLVPPAKPALAFTPPPARPKTEPGARLEIPIPKITKRAETEPGKPPALPPPPPAPVRKSTPNIAISSADIEILDADETPPPHVEMKSERPKRASEGWTDDSDKK